MDQSNSLKPALIRLAAAVCILMLSITFLMHYRKQQENQEILYDIQVVPPTCIDSGYSLYTNQSNGATFVDDLVPATGHQFSDWETDGIPQGIDSWNQVRICCVCQETETVLCYPELNIARLALEGDLTGIGKKSEVPVHADFLSEEAEFTTPATIKYQGHGSLAFDKKNYTLKFFRDEDRSDKYKMTFSHWNPENKYILKANYLDPSQCRNLICADVWAQMVACRSEIPGELRELSNFGAVDGFPIALYINGQFEGLYTMNLHKDDDLFGMSDGEEEAIMIVNNLDSDEAYFRAEAQFTDDSPWEVEFCGTEDSQWAQEKLNELIRFVMESDDETFRENLGMYLDVESALDYLIFIYSMGITRNGADDLVLVTYDRDDPWIASVYDMETAFGLSQDGTSAAEASDDLPKGISGSWDSATGSLLWDRVLNLFFPELQSRYAQLRKTVLSTQELTARAETALGAIDLALYQADDAVYPHPSDLNHSEQICQYIQERMKLLDAIFLE